MVITNIKPIFLAAVAAFVALPLPVGSAAAGTCRSAAGIETTCKAAAKAHPSLDYDYCVRSLNSVSNADSLDLQGLAAAAVRLALADAESAAMKVDDLMDLELDPAARERYRDCYDAYDDAADALRDALDAVSARLYGKAARLLRSMPPGAYKKCERVFKGATGVKSPVGELDGEYERLAGIAMATVSMVD